MKTTIIGAGSMGGALARGILRNEKSGVSLTISNPTAAKLQPYAELGADVTCDNRQAVQGADIVIIAVKPWLVQAVCEELRDSLDPTRQTVVSVAATVKGEDISRWLTTAKGAPEVLVAIPNIAAALGQSMTFVAPCGADDEATAKVVDLLQLVGSTLVVEERLLGAGTTLASCGIAYALRYIRAAMEGGVELGFRASEAQKIVAQTVMGAAALAMQPGAHPESEIDKVTTPGGLTIRGLNEMENAGFTSAVIRGLKAGVK